MYFILLIKGFEVSGKKADGVIECEHADDVFVSSNEDHARRHFAEG